MGARISHMNIYQISHITQLSIANCESMMLFVEDPTLGECQTRHDTLDCLLPCSRSAKVIVKCASLTVDRLLLFLLSLICVIYRLYYRHKLPPCSSFPAHLFPPARYSVGISCQLFVSYSHLSVSFLTRYPLLSPSR